MRSLGAWPIIAWFIAAALPAAAQPNPAVAPDAPPQLQRLDEGEPPAAATPAPAPRRMIVESRAPGGKRTEVAVTGGAGTYYLKPNDQVGSALPGDGQSIAFRPAQWEILHFNLSGSRQPTVAAPPPK